MFNPEKKIGASLLVLGMMISGRAMAQAETTPTCVKAPTCEELGYDKVASDCGELAKLRCPFDPDKYFCTAYTDQKGKKLAEIGDFVYVDAISAEPISGRIPVGIVYDLSGKMMSIAQFTGSTSSQCASYTTDGTSGWSLASMEDMGLIKANVDKINAQLAKIPNTKKIETAKQSGGTSYEENLSCVWKTSDGHACMKKDTAINGSASCCDMSSANTFPNYIKHALCVRSFGSGGAGNDPTPTTYAIGDVYTNDKGVAIGTVFEVEANGQHGTILSRTSRTGTQAEAIEYCDSLNSTTGLTWGLPTLVQMDTVCQKNISGFAHNVEYWTSTTNSTYEAWSSCTNYGNSNQTPTQNLSYFCAAAF